MAWIKYERRMWYHRDDPKHRRPDTIVLAYSKDTGPLGVFYDEDSARGRGGRNEYWSRALLYDVEWFKNDGEWDARFKTNAGYILPREENWLKNLQR